MMVVLRLLVHRLMMVVVRGCHVCRTMVILRLLVDRLRLMVHWSWLVVDGPRLMVDRLRMVDGSVVRGVLLMVDGSVVVFRLVGRLVLMVVVAALGVASLLPEQFR